MEERCSTDGFFIGTTQSDEEMAGPASSSYSWRKKIIRNNRNAKAEKIKEKNQKGSYRRAIFFCARYIDRDPNKMTDNEFRDIRAKLKFIRNFEYRYPHVRRRYLPIDRIPLSKSEATSTSIDGEDTARQNPTSSTNSKKPQAIESPTDTSIPADTLGAGETSPEIVNISAELKLSRGQLSISTKDPTVKTEFDNATHWDAKPDVSSTTEWTEVPKDASTGMSWEDDQSVSPEETLNYETSAAIYTRRPYKKIHCESYQNDTPPELMVPDNLSVAIIDRADYEGKISDGNWLRIESYLRSIILSDKVDANKTRFGQARQYKGVKVINCWNEESRKFLKRAINSLTAPWKGADLVAISISELPCRVEVTAWVPPPKTNETDLLKLLQKQNIGLNIANWRVIKCFYKGCTQVWQISIDRESVEYLKKSKEILSFGLSHVYFRIPTQ
ncbi:uncharacterized protein LOC101891638 [Musca domestica]|uniref:Uncharacterized protein LOC101891638 n=1 Tax=Musca domestica TaxID=7370 RepID=A0A1I8N2D2_MUSDO|nr:uncharacterized protein LOC101891638 [Musca domestica]